MAYRNLAQGLETPVVAFDGDRLLARGRAGDVALAVKRRLEAGSGAQVLVFDDATSFPAEIDYEGSDEEVLRFVESWARRPSPSGPSRREVGLLPRQWEWLDAQPGGAAATLRRLVDEARRAGWGEGRRAQEAAYRFVLTMAGDRPGFEEAMRALFAGDAEAFARESEGWPPDVRDRARELVARGNRKGEKADR